MAEDDWIFETDGGGGGGAFDSGDAEDVEFDDSEAEVFEVDEIDFSEDTDVEVFDAEPLLDEIKAAKASCAESSVEASENSAILWGVAAAAGGAGMVGPAAVAGLGAAAQSYMGAMAQECANDPPRTDLGVVAKFRRVPGKHPRDASPEQAATYAVASASIQVERALAAFTTSIERFDGARAARKLGERTRGGTYFFKRRQSLTTPK